MVLVGYLRISPKFYERIARTHARNTFFFFFSPFFLPFSKKNLSVFFPFLPIVIPSFLPFSAFPRKKTKTGFFRLKENVKSGILCHTNPDPTEQTTANKETEKKK